MHACTFFGGASQSALYDNNRCPVSRVLPDGTRRRPRSFSGFLSNYLVRDRYGQPGMAQRLKEAGVRISADGRSWFLDNIFIEQL